MDHLDSVLIPHFYTRAINSQLTKKKKKKKKNDLKGGEMNCKNTYRHIVMWMYCFRSNIENSKNMDFRCCPCHRIFIRHHTFSPSTIFRFHSHERLHVHRREAISSAQECLAATPFRRLRTTARRPNRPVSSVLSRRRRSAGGRTCPVKHVEAIFQEFSNIYIYICIYVCIIRVYIPFSIFPPQSTCSRVVVKVCVLFSYSPVQTTQSRLINFGVYYPDVTGIALLLLLLLLLLLQTRRNSDPANRVCCVQCAPLPLP
ncbi:hypothetical protein AGLY_013610 [Aphis glycines]|uniref:Uncharacterized protein n=1 Tax=Aphis glycines TaxID=307491 RepID=A0A6G0T843_APHGL|nr:hypothetical protein AGLY_013610 [Aphis glycines]